MQKYAHREEYKSLMDNERIENDKKTILVFTLMNFVLSMTAFLFSGILDKVAASLNVPVASAGMLNSMHSYGSAIGVPLTLILFRKFSRARMLKIMLALSILVNILLVTASGFGILLALRFLSGVSINSYGVLATATVIAMTKREHLGRSLALLIAGNSLALVVGIPFTRAISDLADWRVIFWALIAIMALCLTYFQVKLKEKQQDHPRLNLRLELRLLENPRIYLIFLFTFIMFMGYHGVYNYVTPFLLHLFPHAEARMSLYLVFFGLGSFLGNYLGGRVSDRIGYARSTLLGAVAQALMVFLMLFMRNSLWVMVILISLWVMSSWFMGLQLNSGVAQETNNQSNFLLSLTGSAIQLGSAVGTSIVAVWISAGHMNELPWFALLSALAVTLLQIFSIKRHHSVKENQSDSQAHEPPNKFV